jgi:hypothetical protein
MRGQRVERGYADRRELFLRIEQDVVLEEGLEDVFEEGEEEYHKVVPSAQEVSEPNLAFTDISYLIFKPTRCKRSDLEAVMFFRSTKMSISQVPALDIPLLCHQNGS